MGEGGGGGGWSLGGRSEGRQGWGDREEWVGGVWGCGVYVCGEECVGTCGVDVWVWKYKCGCTFDPHYICTRMLLLSPSLLHSPPLSSLLLFPLFPSHLLTPALAMAEMKKL